MKTLIFKIFTLMMISFSAVAADLPVEEPDAEEDIQRFMVPNKENKQFSLEVIDAGEPLMTPTRLNLVIYCPNGKTKKLLDRREICDYTNNEFKDGKIIINFTNGKYNEKDASVSCEIPDHLSFDYKKECKKK